MWEVMLLVLVTGRIRIVRYWGIFIWHDAHTKFHEDCYIHSGHIKTFLGNFNSSNANKQMEMNYEVRNWDELR